MEGAHLCNISQISRSPLVLLVVSGLVGNAFCLVVLRLKYPRTTVCLLLWAICIADTVMLSSTFIREFVAWFGRTGTLTEVILSYSKYILSDVAQFISVWLIVVLTFTRYMAVARPLHTAQYCSYGRIKLAVLIVVISAVVIEIIRISNIMRCETKLDNSSNLTSETETIYSCRYLYGNQYVRYGDYLYYGGGMFFLPMLPIFYFCVCLIRALHRNITVDSIGRSLNIREEANDITKTVIAIVIVFFLSYSMYMVWILSYEIAAFDNFMQRKRCAGQTLEVGMNFAFNLNSSLNFIIYFICTKSFRKKIRELFACRKEFSEITE